MPRFPTNIEMSDRYNDGVFEYRHVILPKAIYQMIRNKKALLTESEWRSLGITQSRGWVHYATYECEPHILHFRRPLGTDVKTGKANDPDINRKIDEYETLKKNNLTFEADIDEAFDY